MTGTAHPAQLQPMPRDCRFITAGATGPGNAEAAPEGAASMLSR